MRTPDYVPAQIRKKLIPLKNTIVENFEAENWLELGTITDCLDLVRGHERLLRSLRFGDPDYGGAAFEVLTRILGRDAGNFEFIEQYVAEKFGTGEFVSSVPAKSRSIVFSPNVFEVPDEGVRKTLVSVMMPFNAEFDHVHTAIKSACKVVGLHCSRADDIWEHATVIQDIFSLIFRSNIVVCDFTGRNANVFYEAGIAHTLGKHVVPITQSAEDIPFDLRHHRHIRYLNNKEGRDKLQQELQTRLSFLRNDAPR